MKRFVAWTHCSLQKDEVRKWVHAEVTLSFKFVPSENSHILHLNLLKYRVTLGIVDNRG